MIKHALSLVAICVLVACGSVPKTKKYERPALDVPTKLSPLPSAQAGQVNDVNWLEWWKAFQDPALNALLQEAASNNQDLVIATGRIAEAQATLAQNQANFYPQVDLNAGLARTRTSQNLATYNPAVGAYTGSGQLGLSATYEIDFWGRYASANDAARARLLAQVTNRATVLTTLYANVAQSYFALRALDAQLLLTQTLLSTRQENLRLQKRRFEGGLVGELDLRQAESEAASAESSLLVVQQSQSNAEAALAVLVGRKPSEIIKPHIQRGIEIGALVTRQSVPAELPSDVMARRPDIVNAEQNLIAANADIGQARAAYFPKLSLTATLGEQSKDLATLFNPASVFWNMLGNLTQPIFRAGAIDAVVAAANAREQQAVAQYTQTVQNAFRDVHDSLGNVTATQGIEAATTQRIDALRSTLRLAELRYKAGYSSYLEVLSSQRDLVQAESGLIDAQRNRLVAVVGLYKALGGGWSAVPQLQLKTNAPSN